ncbi:MAG: MoxR family ATPase [Ktedonobacteraceae bacterium]|nr:MoxR family ATPase [Ktedonobacteraceae bacterium]
MVFTSIDDLQARLAGQHYVCDRKLATVVFLATRLNKPVLVEGPAGVGKTELAKALAQALDRSLIRLQCYEGLDEARALYEWEYSKQLLYTQVLREKISQILNPAQDLHEAAATLRRHEAVFFSENFLVERPILQAIRSERPAVLLIDEIDRADEEFEAFLLEFLSDYQVSIPELGTLRARTLPLTILTSNRTRELSEALKRRCLHLYIDYPCPEVELEIVRLKAPGLHESLARQLVDLVQSLRTLDLRKAPSISETLDWAQALVVLNAPHLTKELLEETISVIIKYERDAGKALAHLGIHPGQATSLPAQNGHAPHDHGHTHRHGHVHEDEKPQTMYDQLRNPQAR